MIGTVITLGVVASVNLAIPSVREDHGIFASVAERLVAGDLLYSGVWDNKEPIFYYALALGRLVDPAFDLMVELVWIALAGWAVHAIVRWRGATQRAALLVGAGLTPLLLTGGVTVAGYSHLPGTAVTLAATACLLRGKPMAGGFLMASSLFVKILALPVAGLIGLTVLLVRRDLRGFWRWCLGALLAVVTFSAVLAARGELLPWFVALYWNVAHTGTGGGVLSKLARTFMGPSTWSVPVVLTLLVVWNTRFRREREGDRALGWGTLAGGIGGVVIVALTGLWTHHTQILLIGGALALALAAPLQPTARSVAAMLVATILLGGVSLGKLQDAASSPWTRLNDLRTVQPLSAELATRDGVSSYARVGSNDDRGHALGLRNLSLACPAFQQYDFDPPEWLDGIAACLPTADAILVAPSVVHQAGEPDWNSYVDRVDAILRSYRCEEYATGRLCVRP
nr:hypothetical protein [Propionibacterium sp.]